MVTTSCLLDNICLQLQVQNETIRLTTAGLKGTGEGGVSHLCRDQQTVHAWTSLLVWCLVCGCRCSLAAAVPDLLWGLRNGESVCRALYREWRTDQLRSSLDSEGLVYFHPKSRNFSRFFRHIESLDVCIKY